jgi:hypothetical protein
LPALPVIQPSQQTDERGVQPIDAEDESMM